MGAHRAFLLAASHRWPPTDRMPAMFLAVQAARVQAMEAPLPSPIRYLVSFMGCQTLIMASWVGIPPGWHFRGSSVSRLQASWKRRNAARSSSPSSSP